MTDSERRGRTEAADSLCRTAYAGCGGPDLGAALVAVGGYGRGELAPRSDLDVVLVHEDGAEPGDLAERLWYPLWDSGARLDHAVRGFGDMAAAAADDVRVATGLLDLRHLAGDPGLSLRLRSTLLAQWRRDARRRLPMLRETIRRRHDLVGEVAHAAVPDLKEGRGGLRDATVLRALVATWLVEVPHADLERCRGALLDVRDVLHQVAGRATDRIGPELWGDLAAGLGLEDDRAAQRHVRQLGRRLAHLAGLAWRRADAVQVRPEPRRTARTPALTTVGPGVAVSRGEVVLARDARPGTDPLLLLRAAAIAAEREAALNPATAARLATEAAPLPAPWPHAARQLLVRLLGAGPGLRAVWETLEETGALDAVLPEWERVRLRPHASPIHRFTVDRHLVETCVEATALLRTVGRPDVLLVSALLHDIGKGEVGDHSIAGEPIARAVATRTGLDDRSVALVGTLVRHHLLLATVATTRDPDDPATAAEVAAVLGTREALDLLAALTEADARATAPQAWSGWRASLVRRLVERTRALLDATTHQPLDPVDVEVELPGPSPDGGPSVQVEPGVDGSRITVVAPDRLGLLADVSAALALLRVPVRAARAWLQEPYAVSVWEVAGPAPDPAVLRTRLQAVPGGGPAARPRFQPLSADASPPGVVVRPGASRDATVLEVRTADVPGVLHRVCRTLAGLDVAVRSAHVDTLGPQAVDVFYLQEPGAAGLSETRAADAAHAVRRALTAPSDPRDA